jgi:ribosome maturation factor RimP
MIEKITVTNIVEEYLKDTPVFLVTVKVSNANRITVLADTKNGITIDECAELHRFIESKLDREVEDYDLEVSSPGLDSPFLVLNQYYKNEGKKVEVLGTDGVKLSGVLKNVNEGGFELEAEVKVKGKPKELKDVSFNFENVKSTRVILTIK